MSEEENKPTEIEVPNLPEEEVIAEPVEIPNTVRDTKPLNITNSQEAKEATSDLEVFGNPDAWVLLSKVSSKSGNWMKSTKVMDVGSGFVVQVTTQVEDKIAEAITFAPGCKIGNVGGHKALVKV